MGFNLGERGNHFEGIQNKLMEDIMTEDNQNNPIFNEWWEKNDWYLSDTDLSTYANGLTVSDPTLQQLPYKERLREVSRKVREAFPQKFKNLERERLAAVDGGELRSGRMLRSGKGYRDLPGEARQAADKFVERGLFKSREAYAKSYFSEEED